MKTILALLLSCLPLCAATTYSVVTDTPTPGQGQKGVIAGGTVSLVQTNGTQTITGSKNFTAAQTITNASNIIGGDGSRLTGMPVQFAFTTNIWISSVAAVAIGNVTNNGNYANLSPIVEFTHPGFLNTESLLNLYVESLRTNAFTTAVNLAFYGGPNTNFIGAASIAGTAVGIGIIRDSAVFSCNGATSHLQGAALSVQQIPTFTNFVGDCTAPFKLYVGAYTLTAATDAYLSIHLTSRR